mmetsp:Transcript_27300/g.37986  ORF Transcript_27300/g.37986 Transcript_27300/m.37986 type:complete len:584 (+) Transcript_27300:69-1820(+)
MEMSSVSGRQLKENTHGFPVPRPLATHVSEVAEKDKEKEGLLGNDVRSSQIDIKRVPSDALNSPKKGLLEARSGNSSDRSGSPDKDEGSLNSREYPLNDNNVDVHPLNLNTTGDTEEARGGGDSPRALSLSRTLSVMDGLGVTVGIMVGSGVFSSPGEVVEKANGTREALGAWATSTVLVLMGALCYAELGAAFPHAGGDYWFLRLAYGEWAGFAFTWTNFFVLKTGSQAIILYVASLYILGGTSASSDGDSTVPHWARVFVSVITVWLLTFVNCLGLRTGSYVQNVLTGMKGILLVAVALMGFAAFASHPDTFPGCDNLCISRSEGSKGSNSEGNPVVSFMLAMVACLWAFDGWADVAFLGEELKSPATAMPVIVTASVLGVATVFLLVNVAYMLILSREAIENSHAIAIDFSTRIGGNVVGGIVAFGIGISALGSANGSILTGGRVFFAAARDGRFPAILAKLSRRRAPYVALIAQGLVTSVLLCIPNANFKSLLHYFAPASWLFYAATGSTVIALRVRYPDADRPFRCPCYPLPPVIVVTVGLCLVASCVMSSPLYSCAALAFVLLSYPAYRFKCQRAAN